MMQRNKNSKAEKGITLIALIITIIVILILVAVSVRTISKSGLFDHAKDATSKWADEQEKEANIGDEVGNVIDKYVGQHDWKRNGDNLKCDHCGLSFVIGDFVDYQPDPTSKTITIGKEEAGLLETNRTTTDTIDESTVQDQIFTQDAETYWQVLGIEDSDGNGTNETLLIKMAFGTEEALYLRGAAAYNNGPDIMNRISKELYSSSKYGEARSINITDINNTLQYTPGGGFYYDSGYKELSGFNTQMKDIPTWNTVKANGTYTPDETNTEAKLGSYKVNGYFYGLNSLDENKLVVQNFVTESITNITLTTGMLIFATPTGKTSPYWLACRGMIVYDDFAVFGPGIVYEFLVSSWAEGSFSSDGVVYDGDFPVCPVVSLRSEIPAKIPTPNFAGKN